MMKENCNGHNQILPESLLKKATVEYINVFKKVNPAYRPELMYVPKRTLTQPSEPSKNNGQDNIQDDYILRVKELIGHTVMYEILDLMGQGTFGQVVKCRNIDTNELVAIKVIKRQPFFHMQGEKELNILCILRDRVDQSDRFLQLRDHFLFKGHLCAVFELLSISLHKLFSLQPGKPSMAITDIQKISHNILQTLALLKEMKIIHTDLKPDNILIKSKNSLQDVKLIDYGSALLESDNLNYCIQTAFYRSPEVILRMPFDCAIDMWSFGCFVAELFLGEPVFPSGNEPTLMQMMVKALGSLPSANLLKKGRNSTNYFVLKPQPPKQNENEATADVRIRTPVQNSQDFSVDCYRTLKERIMARDVIYSSDTIDDSTAGALKDRLYDFIKHILVFDPAERYTPQQALAHPFITVEIIEKGANSVAVKEKLKPKEPTIPDSSIFAERKLKSILKKTKDLTVTDNMTSQIQHSIANSMVTTSNMSSAAAINGKQADNGQINNNSRVTFALQPLYMITVPEDRSSQNGSLPSSFTSSSSQYGG